MHIAHREIYECSCIVRHRHGYIINSLCTQYAHECECDCGWLYRSTLGEENNVILAKDNATDTTHTHTQRPPPSECCLLAEGGGESLMGSKIEIVPLNGTQGLDCHTFTSVLVFKRLMCALRQRGQPGSAPATGVLMMALAFGVVWSAV